MSDYIIKKVKRIHRGNHPPYYMRMVVGFRYWNGYGMEVDLLGHVLEKDEKPVFPKDGLMLTLKWIWHGCH